MNRALSSDQEQLVQAITEQVLAMLQGQGGEVSHSPENASTQPGPGAGSNGDQPHAAIRPPIGVCTGDYSQFPELRGRRATSAAPTTFSASATPGSASGPQNAGASAAGAHTGGSRSVEAGQADGGGRDTEILTGIVTVSRLEQVAGRASGGVVRLAPEAQLSPLAADHVRDRGLQVERAGSGSPADASATGASSRDGWLWWIDGQCPAVKQITETMASSLRPLPRRRESTALAETVGELASRVQRGEAAGGVLFVPSAAKAGCFANRCESLRAVVASCEQAVIEGVEQLGANVLIVEYMHHGREAMRRMVERFVCTPRPATAAVDRELRELKRCG